MANQLPVEPQPPGEGKRTTVFDFIQQVRDELYRVTWPKRRETAMTSLMVFVMVAIIAVYFVIVDRVVKFGVGAILGFGG